MAVVQSATDRRAATTRPRSRRRRILFVGILLLVVAAGLEFGSFVVFSIADRELFLYGRLHAARQAVSGGASSVGVPIPMEEDQEAIAERLAAARIAIHPYLGYVGDRELGADPPINAFGFEGAATPLTRRRGDRFVVGVLGGSVAVLLTRHGTAAVAAELRKSAYFAGRELVVVNLAVGGFKQPQQLMALNYALGLGAEFDAVVNVDGFNEVALSVADSMPRGVHPLYPRNWDFLVRRAPDPEVLGRIGEIVHLRGRRRQLAVDYSGGIAGRSLTMQAIWRLRDRSLRREISARVESLASFRGPASASTVVAGPPMPGLHGDRIFELIADTWARSSIQLHHVCRGAGIHYLHVLQPNQYVPGSKPMGAAERAVAIHPDEAYGYRVCVEKGYPELAARVVDCRAAGVVFVDGRELFAGVEEPLYSDSCCHYNKTGIAILARRIGQELVGICTRVPAALLEIRVPARVEIRSPFRPAVIDVRGRFDDEQIRHVRRASHGTVYRCDAPGSFTVTPDGEVWARGRGAAKIFVRNGSARAVVEVAANWDSVVPFGTGTPGADGRTPRLAASGDARVGNESFGFVVADVRAEAQGFLLVSKAAGPFPFAGFELHVDPAGVRIPVRASGTGGDPAVGKVRIAYPIPADPSLRGTRSFWQALFEEPGAAHAYSASNALMITIE